MSSIGGFYCLFSVAVLIKGFAQGKLGGNDAQYEQKFSNNYIQLRHRGKKFTDPLLSDEKQMELNLGREISVAAGGSETIYGVIGNIAESLVNDAPIIWVSLDSSVVLQSATPEQNIRPDA